MSNNVSLMHLVSNGVAIAQCATWIAKFTGGTDSWLVAFSPILTFLAFLAVSMAVFGALSVLLFKIKPALMREEVVNEDNIFREADTEKLAGGVRSGADTESHTHLEKGARG